jgi:LPS export ABC transporter protein LptC
MAISKRQSRLLAWVILGGTIVAFILAIALQDRNQGEILSDIEPLQNVSTALPSQSQPIPNNTLEPAKAELQTFHRVETRNGKTLWEIKASHGKLMPETNSALIDNATLLLYRPSGETVRVVADQAVVKLEGATLAVADLSGHVQLAIEGSIDARTDQATLNRKTQTLEAPQHVTIQGKGIFVEGDGLSGNLQSEQYTIHRDVSTIITPKS